MKLRIHGDSIRLRLNRREVAEFAAVGRLEQSCQYALGAGNRLVYALEASRTALEPKVHMAGHAISVILPQTLAESWTETERVGVTADIQLADSKRMTILIEKEFRRLHGANTDPDLYPNPLEALVS